MTDERLQAPGACDNGAGVAGMLAIVHALLHGGVELPAPLVVLGNVGEEGEGDLRGVRHFYEHNALAGRVAAHIVLDGAGADSAVTQALGSRRFQVTITGPGGHSFTDAGTPNPIAALATALARLAETPLPEEPRTTLNLGTIHGGISVNSIPESAQATVDFRSTDRDQLARLEAELHSAVEDAVESCNAKAEAEGAASHGRLVVRDCKDRRPPRRATWRKTPRCWLLCTPWTGIWGCAPTFAWARPTPTFRLALGVPALSMGAGGDGGAAHTLTNGTHPGIANLGSSGFCC